MIIITVTCTAHVVKSTEITRVCGEIEDRVRARFNEQIRSRTYGRAVFVYNIYYVRTIIYTTRRTRIWYPTRDV